ncbi:glycosyltransferase [Roseateles sp. DC23W]|uniref:Glycosyltransferase n=1 Tax=Pelomonas dachongensis TaxID=3299029 RepID=A0ABW7EUB9_9BURK
MSRILMAWEMGANMGHIDRLLLTARALRSRGHEVSFVLRDLSRAHARIAAEGFAIGQAPVWLPKLANPPPLSNYTTVLAAAGWLDAPGLAGLISGWRRWYEVLQPDVLICDHAPTALLASRGLGMSVWTIGTSFEVPPRGAHFPPMAHWEPCSGSRSATDDATLLPAANQALALHGLAPLARLTDLFDGCHQAIASLPELAHYDGYGPDMPFCGPTYVGDSGIEPVWPGSVGPKVFAYLNPAHTEFARLMQALRELGVRALVHAKGLSPAGAQRLGGPQLRFETQPVRLDPALAEADLVVSHGGLGTATAALLAGKPQLAVATHMEQLMTGRRLATQGLGLAVPPGATATDWRHLIGQLLSDTRIAAAARAVADRHRGETATGTAEKLADLIEAGR